jgi:hypothetical protein
MTIGWLEMGWFHPFDRNATDARLIGELGTPEKVKSTAAQLVSVIESR